MNNDLTICEIKSALCARLGSDIQVKPCVFSMHNEPIHRDDVLYFGTFSTDENLILNGFKTNGSQLPKGDDVIFYTGSPVLFSGLYKNTPYQLFQGYSVQLGATTDVDVFPLGEYTYRETYDEIKSAVDGGEHPYKIPTNFFGSESSTNGCCGDRTMICGLVKKGYQIENLNDIFTYSNFLYGSGSMVSNRIELTEGANYFEYWSFNTDKPMKRYGINMRCVDEPIDVEIYINGILSKKVRLKGTSTYDFIEFDVKRGEQFLIKAVSTTGSIGIQELRYLDYDNETFTKVREGDDIVFYDEFQGRKYLNEDILSYIEGSCPVEQPS